MVKQWASEPICVKWLVVKYGLMSSQSKRIVASLRSLFSCPSRQRFAIKSNALCNERKHIHLLLKKIKHSHNNALYGSCEKNQKMSSTLEHCNYVFQNQIKVLSHDSPIYSLVYYRCVREINDMFVFSRPDALDTGPCRPQHEYRHI